MMLAQEAAEVTQLFTSFGPFAVAAGVAAWMMKRSDQRESAAAVNYRVEVAEIRAEYRARVEQLGALLDAERSARLAGEVECARRLGELEGRIAELADR